MVQTQAFSEEGTGKGARQRQYKSFSDPKFSVEEMTIKTEGKRAKTVAALPGGVILNI